MQIDLEKMLDHANERSAGICAAKYEQRAEAIKVILKIETEQPPIRHRFGPVGVEMARGRRSLNDMVVCRARKFTADGLRPSAAQLPDYAIVVLDGYGRRSSPARPAVMYGGGEARPVLEPMRRFRQLVNDLCDSEPG